MSNEINKLVQEVFLDLAYALDTNKLGKHIKIGLCLEGSEHGVEIMYEAARIIKAKDLFEVVLIGEGISDEFEIIPAKTQLIAHQKMEELLDSNYLQGCVTLHYNFPIGVCTIGRIISPAFGKPMLIASTTGSASTNKNQAVVLNAINGIAVAKAYGISNPTLGILNLDGANSIERVLKTLNESGYPLNFSTSKRSDGGNIMRGNDLLMGSVDIMLCDSLTGNILMKLFSAYNTGGSYEALGYGYGPGVGENYKRNICIISRASGAQVIANSLEFAFEMAKNNLVKIVSGEYQLANQANLKQHLETLNITKESKQEEVEMPPSEIVSEQISGIDVMELDDALLLLAKNKIYSQSGMGCTGPILMVNKNNLEKAINILTENKYI